MERFDLGAASQGGPRHENQDRWSVGPTWGVVADGVGGTRGGAEAAGLVVQEVAAHLAGGADESNVRSAVAAANLAVRAGQVGGLSSMGSTLVLAAHLEGGRWLVGHVGDSPAYLATATGCRQVTDDHSFVAELVRAGAITAEQAVVHPQRNVITRCIGLADEVDVDLTEVTVADGDVLVLTSDGISEVFDAEAVGAIVLDAAGGGAEERAQRLLEAAVAFGSRDDVTVVVVLPLPAEP